MPAASVRRSKGERTHDSDDWDRGSGCGTRGGSRPRGSSELRPPRPRREAGRDRGGGADRGAAGARPRDADCVVCTVGGCGHPGGGVDCGRDRAAGAADEPRRHPGAVPALLRGDAERQAEGPRGGQRVHHQPRGLRRHQQPRGGPRERDRRPVRRRPRGEGRRGGRRSGHRRGAAQARRRRDLVPRRARRRAGPPGRRLGRRGRQPARARDHRHRRHRERDRTGDIGHDAYDDFIQTDAAINQGTPAARCSTPTARSSA